MSEEEAKRSDGASGEEPKSYETASERLDEIISRLDSGQAELRETLDLCREAKGLIEYCAAELAAVDSGLEELRLDQLAESLVSSPQAGASEGSGSEAGQEDPGPDRPAADDPGPDDPDPDRPDGEGRLPF